MSRINSSVLVGAIILLFGTSAKADWDFWAAKEVTESGVEYSDLYGINSRTGAATLLKRFCESSSCITSTGLPRWSDQSAIGDWGTHLDKDNIILRIQESASGSYKFYKYTVDANNNLTRGDEVTGENLWYESTGDGGGGYTNYRIRGNIQLDENNNATSDIAGINLKLNSDGSIQIGSNNDGASITSTGVKLGTENLISKKANGEIHIGENSWITKEEGGIQKVWAKDANGNSIPIDYTNGTKLLINGRDVEQAIDNVGALSAALTGLPTVPQDSPLACGAGIGTHSSSNAISAGCASKYSERLSLNLAAAYIPRSQEYQGIDNAWSGRGGFVYKLGKITKPTLISMKEKKALQSEVKDLKSQNLELLSRLEKLEKIALGIKKSTDLASIAP